MSVLEIEYIRKGACNTVVQRRKEFRWELLYIILIIMKERFV